MQTDSQGSVPNVPCGVERSLYFSIHSFQCRFLMYRVELKAISSKLSTSPKKLFLMYRVELKAINQSRTSFGRSSS